MRQLTEEEEFHDAEREARAHLREMVRQGMQRPANVDAWQWTKAYNEVYLEAVGRQRLASSPAKAVAE